MFRCPQDLVFFLSAIRNLCPGEIRACGQVLVAPETACLASRLVLRCAYLRRFIFSVCFQHVLKFDADDGGSTFLWFAHGKNTTQSAETQIFRIHGAAVEFSHHTHTHTHTHTSTHKHARGLTDGTNWLHHVDLQSDVRYRIWDEENLDDRRKRGERPRVTRNSSWNWSRYSDLQHRRTGFDFRQRQGFSVRDYVVVDCLAHLASDVVSSGRDGDKTAAVWDWQPLSSGKVKNAEWYFRFSLRRIWRWQPRSLVEVDRCFMGVYCLHRPGGRGSTYLWNICYETLHVAVSQEPFPISSWRSAQARGQVYLHLYLHDGWRWPALLHTTRRKSPWGQRTGTGMVNVCRQGYSTCICRNVGVIAPCVGMQ
jgi:hypothetical protein